MPELPEVETIVRDLDKKLSGKIISGLESRDHKVFQLNKKQAAELIGAKIGAVGRRGKMLIFNLGARCLLIHLKMTGQLVLKTKNSLIAGGHPLANECRGLPNKFTRVIFSFSGGAKLYFNDVRRFGWIRLADARELIKLQADLGVEPLSKDFTLNYFKKVLSRKANTTIKQALMEQKHISGIGNIYADESLFKARLKPFRRVKTLKPAEIAKLWRAIPKILRYAIKHRGTSFNDYVDAQGETGNFIKYLRVYGRAGEKCQGCGGVVKKIKLGGRGTHWCEKCQK